ncbi:MAG TPA: D-2-hydroxyacid dehydrogenase [Polyangiaceae bacterium]|nr:D-2-hydroxyacid dehydrogenase [Polyangiaceae bacterium]
MTDAVRTGPFKVWCNQPFGDAGVEQLKHGLAGHSLLYQPGRDEPNDDLESAHVVFGKPAVASLLRSEALQWLHVGSAGYTPWDREDLLQRFRVRKILFSRSSMVYCEPCAEQVLSLMLSWARRLPWALDAQRGARQWRYGEIRSQSRLLVGQSALIVGFGTIGERLCELLKPFEMQIVAVRQRVRGDEPVLTISVSDPRLDEFLGNTDHVINLMPLNASTAGFFDHRRLSAIRPGAIFYNIGRGGTVDQQALLRLAQAGHFGALLLDVTEPEPLPVDHPLWSAPNCFITPHSAGGHDNEQERLVSHFLNNFNRFITHQPLLDRVV